MEEEVGYIERPDIPRYKDPEFYKWKARRDEKNILDTACRKAYEEGYKQGVSLKIASKLKELGVSIDIIMRCTDLTAEEIEAIL